MVSVQQGDHTVLPTIEPYHIIINDSMSRPLLGYFDPQTRFAPNLRIWLPTAAM